MHDNSPGNSFEKDPLNHSGEVSEAQKKEADKWQSAMSNSDVPDFSGEQFGVENEGNEYYGEAALSETETSEEYNEDVSDAQKMLGYFNLNKISDGIGIDAVMNGIMNYDTARFNGLRDPRLDFYEHLMSTNPSAQTLKEMRNSEEAIKPTTNMMRDELGGSIGVKTKEGMLKSFQDMKDFIAKVKGADPELAKVMDGGDFNSVKEKAFKKYRHDDLMSVLKYFSSESGVPGFWEEDELEVEDDSEKEMDEKVEKPIEGKNSEASFRETDRDKIEVASKKEDYVRDSLNPEVLNPKIINPNNVPENIDKDAYL